MQGLHDEINARSAADIAFIMSRSKSACFASLLFVQFSLRGMCLLLQICSFGIDFGFCLISRIIKPHACVVCLGLKLQQITQTLVVIIHGFVANKKNCFLLKILSRKPSFL